MSSLSSILSEQSPFGASWDQVFEAIENGTFDELYLFPSFENKTSDQIKELIETVWEPGFDEIKEAIKELKSGLKDEDPSSDYETQQNDADILECEEALEFFRQLDDQIDVGVKSYSMTHLTTAEDASITLGDYSIFDEAEQTIDVQAIGESETLGDDFELVDQDGDGILTGRDYEVQKAAEGSTALASTQDFFANMGNDYRLIDLQYDATTFQITKLVFQRISAEQTMTINIDGPMNVFLEAQSLANIPESLYVNLPKEVLARLYIGDGTEGSSVTSVADELYPLTMDEKIEMTEGRSAILEGLDLIVPYLPEGVDVGQVKELATQSLDKLFEILNSTDALTTLSSQWAEIQSLLSSASPEIASAVVDMMVYAVAVNGGETYFTTFFAGTAPAICENIKLEKGPPVALDFAMFAILEMASGSSGLYGGSGLLTLQDGTAAENTGGTVFLKNSENNLAEVHKDWTDLPAVLEGFELCQDMSLTAGWFNIDAPLQNMIGIISTHVSLGERGLSTTLNDELYAELKGAQGFYSGENGDSLHMEERYTEADSETGDGIGDGDMTKGVDMIMLNILSCYDPENPISLTEVAGAIQTAMLGMVDVDTGDILASWLFVMAKKAPKFLKSLFVADPSFAGFLTQSMASEHDSALIKWARGKVNTLEVKAQKIRNELNVSSTDTAVEEEETEEPTDV